MSKVGDILRKRRELESISIEETATQTMIAKKYIIALEEGNFSVFPADVYAKGFLRNYANFLGFNKDEIDDLVAQYELEWQEALFELPISTPEKTPTLPKTNRIFYMIVSVVIISLTMILILYFAKQKTLLQQKMVYYSDPTKILEEEDIFKAEDIIIKKRIEEVKKTKEEERKEPPATIEVLLEGFASDKVWMQATIDNQKIHQVFLEPDQRIKWQAKEKIFLTIGNAGGIVFKLNERYIGALGRKGEVKKILVTSAGVEVIKTQGTLQKEEKSQLATPLEEKISISPITTSGTPSQHKSTPTVKLQQPTNHE